VGETVERVAADGGPLMGLFPGSYDSINPATIYGPLPTHGKTNVALVLHTTETTGMPGFNHGDTAPHYVYSPLARTWTMWAEYEDGYVGTLKGHTSACHGNCQAFQVEILGYSDPSHDPWVGDFGDDQYRDLADFYKWAVDRYGIGTMVTPTPAGGWLYGTSSPHRLTCDEWDEFTGLTAHGAVPQNTHWDTGVLDLQRIHDLALEAPMPGQAPNIDECQSWEVDAWQKAFDCDCATPNLINDNTHPQDTVSKAELFTFFDRLGIFDG